MNKKKELVGKVVSTKNDKTAVVLVDRYKKHPLYGKRVKKSKKYQIHDENNSCQVGDKVRIAETKHISKNKYFVLVEIIEKAVE